VKATDNVELVLMDIPIPAPRPSEALIKVRAAGLCGSDIAIRNNTFMGRHGRVKMPIIPGHEFVGEVAEVGSQVSKVKIGERVITSCILGCGECYACRTGALNRCRRWDHIGIDSPGGFAEYVCVDQDILFQVPDFIPDEHAAILEPITTGIRSVRTNSIVPGSVIAVFGPGPFGVSIMQAMRATSPIKLIMVGMSRDTERLAIARELGATDTLLFDREDVVSRINEMTNGRGADYVVEATGNIEAVAAATDAAAAGALILMGGSGFGGQEIRIKPWNFVRDEKQLKGLQGLEWADYLLAVNMLEKGLFRADKLVSGVYGLEDINEACRVAEEKKVMKLIIRP